MTTSGALVAVSRHAPAVVTGPKSIGLLVRVLPGQQRVGLRLVGRPRDAGQLVALALQADRAQADPPVAVVGAGQPPAAARRPGGRCRRASSNVVAGGSAPSGTLPPAGAPIVPLPLGRRTAWGRDVAWKTISPSSSQKCRNGR